MAASRAEFSGDEASQVPSVGSRLCSDCPASAKNNVPDKGECRNWNLCRQCWRNRGHPFIAPSYNCTEANCSNISYRTKGMAYRLLVCQTCFSKLRSETLAATYNCTGEPRSWAQFWASRTVFLGNLPYKWERTDIESRVREHAFPHRDAQLPLFYVRCEKGGRQGDHGIAKKVFKGFAFMEFHFARDATVLLQKSNDIPLTMDSRVAVVRPCVIRGSWMWLWTEGIWARCHNYERIDQTIEMISCAEGKDESC